MAFGLTPNYVATVSFDGLSSGQYLILAIDAVKALGWNLGNVNNQGLVAYTPFSMSSWSEEFILTFENEDVIAKSQCTGSQIIDWGKNRRNVESFFEEMDRQKQNTDPGTLASMYKELEAGWGAADVDTDASTPLTVKSKKTGIMALFTPSGGYFVTPIIIYVNLAVFVLMVMSGADFFMPDNETLLAWGANFRPLTLEGQWWRLLTCCFVHIGIIHLLFNMYALVYIGLLLEPYLGRTRFAVAYLLTGVASGTASLWWHDLTVSAGASGAIFGLYGVFLALLTTNFIEKSARRALLTSIGIFVFYNLANGMKGGIDNAAHLGGLLSGIVIGYSYLPTLKAPGNARLQQQIILALTAAILFTCSAVYRSIPNDVGTYDKKIQEFAAIENKALHIYTRLKSAPKDSLLAEVNYDVKYWNEDIALIDSLDKLKLPDMIHRRNQTLIRYCNLRIKSYHLIYKAVAENSAVYKDSIESYNHSISDIIDSLKGNK